MADSENNVKVGVIVVEDNRATLEALSAEINDMAGFVLLAAVDGYRAGLKALSAPYQLLLVDLNLGDGSGIDLIRASRQLRPQARILVISVLGDERTVVQAVEAGADGYVLKDSSRQGLATQFKSVMAGDAPISPGIARHLLNRLRDAGPGMQASADAEQLLSPRELQVLESLAQGLSYKDVARRFNLSVHTIGDYAKALYRKLRVRSRGEAVNVALKHRLIDVDVDHEADESGPR